MIPTPYKVIALLLTFIAIVGACMLYGHFQYARGVRITTLTYETAIAKQKNAAAQQLAVVTQQVEYKEQTLQAAKNTQDIKDVQHTQIVSSLSNKLRDALNANIRVCNSSTECGNGSSSANGKNIGNAVIGANNIASGNGILSANFADVLEQLTLDADTINNAYVACRADAIQIRDILK